MDFDKPALRFMLYGRNGCGKSITLAHMTHYGHQEGFITMTFSQVWFVLLFSLNLKYSVLIAIQFLMEQIPLLSLYSWFGVLIWLSF